MAWITKYNMWTGTTDWVEVPDPTPAATIVFTNIEPIQGPIYGPNVSNDDDSDQQNYSPPAPVYVPPPVVIPPPPLPQVVIPIPQAPVLQFVPPPVIIPPSPAYSTPPAPVTTIVPQASIADIYAAARPDLAVNWNRAHDPAWISMNPDSAGIAAWVASFPTFEAYFEADHAGQFYSPPAAAIPPPPLPVITPPLPDIFTESSPTIPVVIPTAVVIPPPPIVELPTPGQPIVPIDIFSSPTQTANTPVPAMTAADYAAQRLDLLVNWQRAHTPLYAGSSISNLINGFPSLVAYLANDYGQAFSPGPAPTVPQDIVNMVNAEVTAANAQATAGHPTAAQYAAQRADLVLNWQRAHDPAWASDPNRAYILQFPTIEAYLANDYGMTFAPGPAVVVPTVIPPGQTTTTPPAGTPPASTNTGGTVVVTPHRAADSTFHPVGNDKWGNAVFQLIDEGGNLIQWTVFEGKMVDTVNLFGAPLGVYVPQAQTYTSSAVGVPVVTLPGGGNSSNQRPQEFTKYPVGKDKWGYPVYQMIDAGGNLIQWTEFGSTVVDLINLYGAPKGTWVPQAQTYTTHAAPTTDTTHLPPAPTDGSGTVVVTTPVEGKSNTGLLLVGALALAYLAFRGN